MPDSEPKTADHYKKPLDAIVLAGTDDNPRRMILGQNKAFLQIGGKSLVRRAVEALQAAESIGRIYVVGPRQQLAAVLGDLSGSVVLVEQAGKMLANAWQAIYASEADHRAAYGKDDPERPLFFISSDLPLVSAEAGDDFVRRCAGEDLIAPRPYAMLAGVADEGSLQAFYPRDGKAGIRRPYVHLAEHRLRLANLYVGRPRALSNQSFLQTGFDHRKAEKWKNVLSLAARFLSQPGGWSAAWMTFRLQATLLASRGGGVLYARLRQANGRERVERLCSNVIGGGVRIVLTPFGGLSLDADNEDDFRVLAARYEEWIRVRPGDVPGESF
jgi:molybdopterin-guanine dinucleotide biosynthesis protein A